MLLLWNSGIEKLPCFGDPAAKHVTEPTRTETNANWIAGLEYRKKKRKSFMQSSLSGFASTVVVIREKRNRN